MLIDLKKLDQEKENDSKSFTGTVGNHTFSYSRKLKDVLSALEIDDTVHWVSNGDWSMHEMLIALLNKYGGGIVHLSSYGFSELPARTIAELKQDGVITTLFCLVDNRIDTRSASALALIQNVADKCVLTDTHAKVTVLQAGNNYITVIGSANYTSNKRYEAGIVTTIKEVALFHRKWINDELQGKVI